MTDIQMSFLFIYIVGLQNWLVHHLQQCLLFSRPSATCSYNFSTIPGGMLSYGRMWLPKEITHNESECKWERFTAKWHTVTTIPVPDSSCFNNRERGNAKHCRLSYTILPHGKIKCTFLHTIKARFTSGFHGNPRNFWLRSLRISALARLSWADSPSSSPCNNRDNKCSVTPYKEKTLFFNLFMYLNIKCKFLKHNIYSSTFTSLKSWTHFLVKYILSHEHQTRSLWRLVETRSSSV